MLQLALSRLDKTAISVIWGSLQCSHSPHVGVYGKLQSRKLRRKETIYLMTHSTHFILRLFGVGRKLRVSLSIKLHIRSDSRKEGNVLSSQAVNSFCYDVGDMIRLPLRQRVRKHASATSHHSASEETHCRHFMPLIQRVRKPAAATSYH